MCSYRHKELATEYKPPFGPILMSFLYKISLLCNKQLINNAKLAPALSVPSPSQVIDAITYNMSRSIL